MSNRLAVGWTGSHPAGSCQRTAAAAAAGTKHETLGLGLCVRTQAVHEYNVQHSCRWKWEAADSCHYRSGMQVTTKHSTPTYTLFPTCSRLCLCVCASVSVCCRTCTGLLLSSCCSSQPGHWSALCLTEGPVAGACVCVVEGASQPCLAHLTRR